MKTFSFNGLLFLILMAGSSTALAVSSGLYIQSDGDLLNVQELIDDGEDVQAYYDFDHFCYQGSPEKVALLIENWSMSTDYFFSGGGGGFVLRSVKVQNGVSIEMTLEDEVVPGEYSTVLIDICP